MHLTFIGVLYNIFHELYVHISLWLYIATNTVYMHQQTIV